MTKESNLPPPTISEEPREPPHILFNAPWAHIRGGLSRSGREADLFSPPSSSETHNALCYTSIPHSPLRRNKDLTSSHLKRGKRDAVDEKKKFLWNLIWPSEGKVCSSLLAVRVTQWDALCGPASPVRYTAHCASHSFTVKTTCLFIQHVADKPTALFTDIYKAGCLLTRQGGPATVPQWYTLQLLVSRWAQLYVGMTITEREKKNSRKKVLFIV